MRYLLQDSPKTHCKGCDNSVTLLCEDDKLSVNALPWFYICWVCKRVFQVGKGEIPYALDGE